MKTIITHDGAFHMDEVWAVALFGYFYDIQNIPYTVERTRDIEKINKADVVIDVGGIYDPKHLRFDHHQNGFPLVHSDNIPYASTGIVFDFLLKNNDFIWKHIERTDHVKEAYKILEDGYIIPIDANDNGVEIEIDITPDREVSLYSILGSFKATYKENKEDNNEAFMIIHNFMKSAIPRVIITLYDRVEEVSLVKKALRNKTGSYCEIPAGISRGVIQDILSESDDCYYFMKSRPEENIYSMETVNKKGEKFTPKKMFPESWAGLRDGDFEKASGVKDLIFCHKNRFLCSAKTHEAIMELYRIAEGK